MDIGIGSRTAPSSSRLALAIEALAVLHYMVQDLNLEAALDELVETACIHC